LNGETAGCDTILSQAELLERSARSDLNLGRNNINAGDLLRDCMLDLAVAVLVVSFVPTLAVTYIRGLISMK
jgi:hypothetical protein